MNCRLFRTGVTCLLIFVIGCASTAPKRVAVPSYDYEDLTGKERIFVTTKAEETYEMTNFTVTETHIKGTRIVRDSNGKVTGKPEVEISLDDVEFVEMEKSSEEKSGTRVFMWVLSGIGLGVLILLAACSAWVILGST